MLGTQAVFLPLLFLCNPPSPNVDLQVRVSLFSMGVSGEGVELIHARTGQKAPVMLAQRGVWSPPPYSRALGEIQIRHEPSLRYLEYCSGVMKASGGNSQNRRVNNCESTIKKNYLDVSIICRNGGGKA